MLPIWFCSLVIPQSEKHGGGSDRKERLLFNKGMVKVSGEFQLSVQTSFLCDIRKLLN